MASESFPYLDVATRFDVPYRWVLHAADEFDEKQPTSVEGPSLWFVATFIAWSREQERRRENQVGRQPDSNSTAEDGYILSASVCPNCQSTKTEMGYGLAGGSFGPYEFCLDCGTVFNKHPDWSCESQH